MPPWSRLSFPAFWCGKKPDFLRLTRRILSAGPFWSSEQMLFGLPTATFSQPGPDALNLAALTALGYGLCASYAETDNLFIPIGAYAYLQLLTILGNLPMFHS